ncbi:hypothetical protein, partial [Pseudomonas aeruginosa]|uniref:hypothetical protein n=1 Tax=Pseudomonas aeruginosa TaxID=287 RepID=UPI001EE1A049
MTSKLNISSGSSGGQQVTQHPTRRLDQTAVSMWMILGQSNQTLEILAVKYNRLRIYIDSLSFPLLYISIAFPFRSVETSISIPSVS